MPRRSDIQTATQATEPGPPSEERRDRHGAGLTVADVAARYRVSPDKVRSWIRSGELLALNTASALCGKPRFIITPEGVAQFERGRAAAKPKTAPRRKRKSPLIDFFPGE